MVARLTAPDREQVQAAERLTLQLPDGRGGVTIQQRVGAVCFCTDSAGSIVLTMLTQTAEWASAAAVRLWHVRCVKACRRRNVYITGLGHHVQLHELNTVFCRSQGRGPAPRWALAPPPGIVPWCWRHTS